MASTPPVTSSNSRSYTSTILPESRFPSVEEIQEAMLMAEGSIEAAEYLALRIRELAANSKLMKNSPELRDNIFAAVDKFVEAVKFKLTASNEAWDGEVSEDSDLQNMHKNIVAIAIKELGDKQLAALKIDYAIGDDGRYIRAYTSNTGALDPATASNLDKVFNAWLASKGYIIKGGYIYGANADTKEERNRLSAAEVKKLLAEGGLLEYMAANGVKGNVSMKAHDDSGAAQAKKEVASAVDRAGQVERTPAADAGSSPKAETEETPSAGAPPSH